MASPVIGWVSQALVSKLGVFLTIEFGSQLAEVLQSRYEKTIQEYELDIRNQSLNNLNQARLDIKDILYLSQDNKEKSFNRNIFYLSKQISNLSDKISYSGLIGNRVSENNKKKIIYINTIILSITFSIISELKNVKDKLYEGDLTYLRTEIIRKNIREIENIIEIKNIMQISGDENIMLILSENNPDLFIKIRALSGIMYRMEEMKKPLIGKSKYYEQIQGYTLFLLDEVVKQRGPIVSLTHLYIDFKKEYPNIELNQTDFEKSINNLAEQGMIESISKKGEGYKVIKIKPLMLTEYYQKTLELVLYNLHYLETGLTKEDLSINLGFNLDHAETVLDEMAKEDIAWEHEGKYYFPGLAEHAFTLKTESNEVI
ncbi:MAG: hypothetical protein ACTSRE_15510 [Promethearchaeota archaeon]